MGLKECFDKLGRGGSVRQPIKGVDYVSYSLNIHPFSFDKYEPHINFDDCVDEGLLEEVAKEKTCTFNVKVEKEMFDFFHERFKRTLSVKRDRRLFKRPVIRLSEDLSGVLRKAKVRNYDLGLEILEEYRLRKYEHGISSETPRLAAEYGGVGKSWWCAHKWHPVEALLLKPVYRLCGGDERPVFSTMTAFLVSGYFVHGLLPSLAFSSDLLSLLLCPWNFVSTALFGLFGAANASQKKRSIERAEAGAKKNLIEGTGGDFPKELMDALEAQVIGFDDCFGTGKEVRHVIRKSARRRI